MGKHRQYFLTLHYTDWRAYPSWYVPTLYETYGKLLYSVSLGKLTNETVKTFMGAASIYETNGRTNIDDPGLCYYDDDWFYPCAFTVHTIGGEKQEHKEQRILAMASFNRDREDKNRTPTRCLTYAPGPHTKNDITYDPISKIQEFLSVMAVIIKPSTTHLPQRDRVCEDIPSIAGQAHKGKKGSAAPQKTNASKNKLSTVDSKPEKLGVKRTRKRPSETLKYYNDVKEFLDGKRNEYKKAEETWEFTLTFLKKERMDLKEISEEMQAVKDKNMKLWEEIRVIDESTVADYLKEQDKFKNTERKTIHKGVSRCDSVWKTFNEWRNNEISPPGKEVQNVRETYQKWTTSEGRIDGLTVERRESESSHREQQETKEKLTETRLKKAKEKDKNTDKDT